MKNGIPPINIKYTDTLRYFSAFDHYRENNYDPSKMIEIITEYANQEIERYIDITKKAERLSE